MDDDDDFEITEPGPLNPERLNWTDVPIAVLIVVEGVFESFGQGVRSLRRALTFHSADIAERNRFKKSAGADIEAITHGG